MLLFWKNYWNFILTYFLNDHIASDALYAGYVELLNFLEKEGFFQRMRE